MLEAGLNAANMPADLGGQGLDVFDQVIVEEQLGRLTNSLWALVWRPANALLACSDEQRERYLLPAIEGRRRGAFAITEADAGSDPSALSTTAEPVAKRLPPPRREMVRHVGRHRRLSHRPRQGGAGQPVRPLSPRQGARGCRGERHPPVHAHLRVRAPDVLARRGGAGGVGPRRGRPGLRAHEGVVRRGAPHDRRPLPRRRRARLFAKAPPGRPAGCSSAAR